MNKKNSRPDRKRAGTKGILKRKIFAGKKKVEKQIKCNGASGGNIYRIFGYENAI